MDDKEKVIQIQLNRGADNRPIMMCLTNCGRIFVSDTIWGTVKWGLVESPDLIPF